MKRLVAAFVLALATGCASLGLQPADTWAKKIAYANGSVTAVYKAVPLALERGAIDKPTGRAVVAKANEVGETLDLLSAVGGNADAVQCLGEQRTAVACLTAVTEALVKLENLTGVKK